MPDIITTLPDDRVISVTLQKGLPGPQGLQGPQGPQGEVGLLGVTPPLTYNADTQTAALTPGTTIGQQFAWQGTQWSVQQSDNVSIKAFGAVGDGVADDRTVIQQAIDTVDDGTTLYFPAGTYTVTRDGLFCLQVLRSNIRLMFAPGASLRLADGELGPTDDGVHLIEIGDGVAVVENISIVGGALDGNRASNAVVDSTSFALIRALGQVRDLHVARMRLHAGTNGGVIIDGQDTDNRAERLFFDQCVITDCYEGMVFNNADQVHFTRGSIHDIYGQDGFEPEGNVSGWSLTNSYIARAGTDNSEIDIFPDVGDCENGVIENCVLEDAQVRIAVGSGTGAGTARHLRISGCYFNRSQVLGLPSGNKEAVQLTGNYFEGPATHTPAASNNGIEISGPCPGLVIAQNTITNYGRNGIVSSTPHTLISGNTIYNNGQDDTQSVVQRLGILATGGFTRVTFNDIYDDQVTPTQQAGMAFDGDGVVVMGNLFDGHPDGPVNNGGKGPTNMLVVYNRGLEGIYTQIATVPLGESEVDLPVQDEHWPNNADTVNFSVVQPLSDMAPATRAWLDNQANMTLQLDAAVAADTSFLIRREATTSVE